MLFHKNKSSQAQSKWGDKLSLVLHFSQFHISFHIVNLWKLTKSHIFTR